MYLYLVARIIVFQFNSLQKVEKVCIQEIYEVSKLEVSYHKRR